MEYTPDYDITLLMKYGQGLTSPEEERDILLWLEQSEENMRFFSDMLSNISIHSELTSASSEEECEAMVSRLNARIDGDDGRSPRKALLRWIPSAAAFAVAALFAVLFFNGRQGEAPVPLEDVYAYSYANTSSSSKTLYLADRTKVYLKPGSEIRYDVSSLSDRRILTLEGEGYFDIAKDSLRPFTVKTDNVQIRVLGTAFSVSSRHDSPSTEVILERGSVRLMSPDGTPLVRLSPNQKAVCCRADGEVTVEEIAAYASIMSEYSIISLENVTLREIVSSIENSFGIKISSASGPNAGKRYYFQYLRTDSPHDVVAAANLLTGNKLTINNH